MTTHTLHLKAPGNWINDPNGFIYYKGRYHLFYQYFPYAPVWGTMHWGHAVSEDLIHWEHIGTALFPTKYSDQNGCFSGSALEHDGKLNLYYTGIHYAQADKENVHTCVDDKFTSSQMMISSEDGFHFDNFGGKRVVVSVITDEEIGDPKDTRDPKVWEEDGIFYMILGSTYKEEVGRVIFYRSEDAVNWRYAGQLRSERFGRILECPDLFRLEKEYVFIGSPMYIAEDAGGYRHHAVCMPAEFDAEACTLKLPQHYQYVDYGLDLYAPQTTVDKEGRRVMIAWLRMPKVVEEEGEEPWIGMMTIPRVIEMEDEHIYFRVHPEVDKFFLEEAVLQEPCQIEAVQKENEGKIPVEISRGCRYRVQTKLREGEDLNIGGYHICLERGFVKADRTAVFAGIEGHRLVSTTPQTGRECALDIFIDRNLIEIFIDDGRYVISNIVYGLGDSITGYVEKIWKL